MMEELKRMLEIAEESLQVQKNMDEKAAKMLELTEGMHKLMREMRRMVLDKLGSI